MTRVGDRFITLNNDVRLPALGFGVFQSAGEDTVPAVSTALARGYRLIDTAAAYANEREVGEAIRRSGIGRTELFVQTKLWISSCTPKRSRTDPTRIRSASTVPSARR